MNPRAGPRRSGGLFRRIFASFVVTALASALIAGVGAWAFAARFSSEWVADTLATVEAASDAIAASIDDPQALERHVADLAAALDRDVAVYAPRTGKIAGRGPDRPPPSLRGRRSEMRHGGSAVFRDRPLHGPGVAVRLDVGDPNHGTMVVVFPDERPQLGIPLLSVALLVVVLGIGAWGLSRSLARRLAQLETGAGRIAGGDLAHRLDVAAKASDELDELALAFNEMAAKLQALVLGQRTLLANVSHELRTPLSRIKVLVEILQERAERLPTNEADAVVQRLRRGLGELAEDVRETETLIADLLTSGRLELRDDGGLVRQDLDLTELARKVAAKFDAHVQGSCARSFSGDELLLERLLSNLLSNARRAAPTGRLVVELAETPEGPRIAVVDEGPGVPREHRETIFEPFTRLDAARDRDRGGAGLGLHLCRLVCRAHGGTIRVVDRNDGRPGARFEIALPWRGTRAAAPT